MADAQQLDPWTQAADPDVMQRKVLLLSTHAILEAVATAGPTGAPGGVIYAALSEYGCTLQNYEVIMSTLVDLGRLQKRGDCYFAVTK